MERSMSLIPKHGETFDEPSGALTFQSWCRGRASSTTESSTFQLRWQRCKLRVAGRGPKKPSTHTDGPTMGRGPKDPRGG